MRVPARADAGGVAEAREGGGGDATHRGARDERIVHAAEELARAERIGHEEHATVGGAAEADPAQRLAVTADEAAGHREALELRRGDRHTQRTRLAALVGVDAADAAARLGRHPARRIERAQRRVPVEDLPNREDRLYCL